MPMASFRVIESAEEASLHPHAIWNHWKTYILWDHRTYYVILEFIATLVIILGIPQLNTKGPVDKTLEAWLMTSTGALLLLGICPIHWYSNQRQSTHFLTKARTHLAVLIFLTIAVLGLQMVSQYLVLHKCSFNCGVMNPISMFLWMTIAILIIAAIVVWTSTRNPRKDFILAELPSPTGSEDYYRPAWSSANVADGIEDDSLEPEGQVMLT